MTSLLVSTPVDKRVPAVECAAMKFANCAAMMLKPAAGIGKYSQMPPRWHASRSKAPKCYQDTDNKEDRDGHAQYSLDGTLRRLQTDLESFF